MTVLLTTCHRGSQLTYALLAGISLQSCSELTGGRAKAGVRLTAVASTVMASPAMGEKSDYESLESLSSRAIRASESLSRLSALRLLSEAQREDVRAEL